MRFLVHHKSKEGYSRYEHYEKRVLDVMNVLEALYPEKQMVLEVDHSTAGHAEVARTDFTCQA